MKKKLSLKMNFQNISIIQQYTEATNNVLKTVTGCAGGTMVNGSVREIIEPSSYSSHVRCIHFRTNVLGKYRKLSLLPYNISWLATRLRERKL